MKTFLLLFFWLFCFFWLIRSLSFFRNSGLSQRTLNIFFILKLFAGLVLFLIYTYYYPYRNTSDAFRYFDDSQVIYKTAFKDPEAYLRMVTGIGGDIPGLEKFYREMETWSADKNYSTTDDNRTIVRVNAIISLFSSGIYFIHILFFCFLSFCGLTALYRFISSFSPEKKNIIACCVFLPPSLLFWTSGVLKESLVFFGIGLFLFHFSRTLEKPAPRNLALTVLFIAMFSLIKIYILITLLPALAYLLIIRLSKVKRPALPAFLIAGLLIAGVAIAEKLPAPFNPLPDLAAKQKDFINVAKGGTYLINCTTHDTIYIDPSVQPELLTRDSIHYTIAPGTPYKKWTYRKVLGDAVVPSGDTTCYTIYLTLGKTGSGFNITELQPNARSLFRILPEAYSNALFRPYLSEVDSAMIAMSFVENIIYLLFLLFCLTGAGRLSYDEKTFIFFSILFIVVLAAIIGIVTPVTGALVRYRIVLYPFLLSSIAMISKPGRIEKYIS